MEGELKDLSVPRLGALKDLPELSENPKLRLPPRSPMEGALKDLPLLTLGALKDFPSPPAGPLKFISFLLSTLLGCLTEPPLLKGWLLLSRFVNLRSSVRPPVFGETKLLPLDPLPIVTVAVRSRLRSKIDDAPLLLSLELNPLLREISAVLKVSPVLLLAGSIVETLFARRSKK